MKKSNQVNGNTGYAAGSTDYASKSKNKKALEQFKYEVADELGVPLKKGYNGDLTSRQTGSIGGQMVKKMVQAEVNKMDTK